MSIKLTEGEQLGVASLCDLYESEEPESNPERMLEMQMPESSTCASMNALPS